MTTTYRVTSRDGRLLGIFPQGALADVKSIVDANPGAEVKSVVSHAACAKHPAFEADYCPTCGTSQVMSH